MLKQYVEDVHKLYGNQLKTIILYGSYARGDFRLDSDIDIYMQLNLDAPDGARELAVYRLVAAGAYLLLFCVKDSLLLKRETYILIIKENS